MRIALIGNGIVAAFCIAALRDELGSHNFSLHLFAPENRFVAPPPGAFYLHEVPGVSVPFPSLTVAEMRYGRNPQHYAQQLGVRRSTSIDHMPNVRMRGVFQASLQLVGELTSHVRREHHPLTVQDAADLELLRHSHDLVILTANVAQDDSEVAAALTRLPVLNLSRVAERNDDVLSSYLEFDVRVLRGMMEHGLENLSVYNASHGRWLRATKLGRTGDVMVELSPSLDLPQMFPTVRVPKLAEDTKARRSKYDNLLLAGRFATWNRKDLSHHAYYQTMNKIREMRS